MCGVFVFNFVSCIVFRHFSGRGVLPPALTIRAHRLPEATPEELRQIHIGAESGLIRKESTHNRTLYHLTEGGCETIHYFSRNLPPAIKKDIDEYLKEKQFDLKEEASVKADYYTTRTNEYEVRCRIEENGSNLIDLKLTVPTEQEAEAIANRWNAKSQEIYTLLLTKLL